MAKIEDYGDKIGGAKKDLFAEYAFLLSGTLDPRDRRLWDKPLSDLFPKPNYAALAAKDVAHARLAALCALRGAIPRKPTGNAAARQIPGWLTQVNAARMAAMAVTSPISEAAVDALMAQTQPDIRRTYAALKGVPSAGLSKAEGHRVVTQRGTFYLITPARKILFEAPQTAASDADLVRRAAKVLSGLSGKAKPAAAPARDKVETLLGKIKFRRVPDRTWEVELTTAAGRIVFKSGLPNPNAADVWLGANIAAVRARIQASLEAPAERTNVFRPRTGPARRDGDVSAARLAEEFGLRGIEFGNYVEGPRRQADLNAMWDSFCDLSEVLGVPRRAVGRGALAVAFGARGHGRASAHYEPGRRVINLTKSSGAGSAAHEWFHSEDNAATMPDPSDKHARSVAMFSDGDHAAMRALRAAWGPYAERMRALDAGRAKPYWSKDREMAAHCFEVALRDRLAEAGIVNDHLVEIARDSEAYPTDAEMRDIGPAVDALTRVMLGVAARVSAQPVRPEPEPVAKPDPAAFTEDDQSLLDLLNDPEF